MSTLSISWAGYSSTAVSKNIDDGTNYKTHDYTIETAAPEVMYHVPDIGDTEIVRIQDGDRMAQLVITVYGTSRDGLDNNINDLRLLLRNASKHHIDDAFPLYYLTTQPENATSPTYHDIKVGWLDDSKSHFEEWQDRNIIAYNTVMYLILTPYGYQDSIILENYLTCSAAFLEDSDADGLADGWNESTAATTVTGIESSHVLIGHQCQYVTVTADASYQGIFSDTVTVAQSTNITAFVWLCFWDGTLTDLVSVQLLDGANTIIDEVEVDPADPGSNSTTSVVSPLGGDTWYRYDVSGLNSGAADTKLRIARSSGNASDAGTFFVDGAYLNIDSNPVSHGWISARRTENNNSLDTEADINYVDVWGIPGDADAVALWKPTTDDDGLGFYMARHTDGVYLASQQVHWLDSADGSGTSSGSGVWTTNSSANWAGGSAALFTEGATNNGGYFQWTISGAAARKLFATPRSAILLCQVGQAAAVDATILLSAYIQGGTIDLLPHNVTVTPTVETSILAIDIGTINLTGLFPADVPDTAEPDVLLRITLDNLANTETFYIDALYLPPVVDDYMVYQLSVSGSWTDSRGLWINGHNKTVVPQIYGVANSDYTGTMWTLAPGQTMNRITYLQYNSTNYIVNYSAGFLWKLEVTPRGRHLIGNR